jgi:hypothetical protein
MTTIVGWMSYLETKVYIMIGILVALIVIIRVTKYFLGKKKAQLPITQPSSVVTGISDIVHVYNGASVTDIPQIQLSEKDIATIATASINITTSKNFLQKDFASMMVLTVDEDGTHTMKPIIPMSSTITLPDKNSPAPKPTGGIKITSYAL